MKTCRRIGFLLFPLFFLTPTLWSQSHTIGGKITDGQNRQPIAFVNVVVNDGSTGGMSDINGKYEISSLEPIRKVKFSCLGFETKEIDIQPEKRKYDVVLNPITFKLREVTVEAGVNPAHRIIDSLVAHRKANNPNSLGSYRYKIYDQMVITIDSSGFGNAMSQTEKGNDLRIFDSILKKSDLMVMETASEVLFKAPDSKLQNVLGTKVAGMKDPAFIYLVNSMQSISFYDETINIAGTEYVNPISRGSIRHYSFSLESASPIGQGDSLYVISFHPRQGSTFNGLRGTMTVNSDGWALQGVKASPNEQDGMFNASIQQLYQKIEHQWFPKQLNTNLKFPGVTADIDGQRFPMIAIGKSYLTDIEINPEISQKQFSDIEINVFPEAGYRDESFWNAHRIDSLTERIRATYILVDSLTQGSAILDRTMNLTNKLLNEAAIPIGPVNLDIGRIIHYSVSRGLGFGLGLGTNNRLSRHVRLNGFVSYWPKRDYIDFGGGFQWSINPQRQMQLELKVAQESDALGGFNGLQENNALLSESNYKYTFYENMYVRKNQAETSFSSRFARHFKGFVGFSMSHKRYNERFSLSPSDSLAEAIFAIAEVKLRFAYKERFLSQPDGIRSLGTLYPIVWLSYQHSFPGILGSSFEYDRIKFEATQHIYTPYLGVATIVLQAGYASATCPVMEAFDILGTYVPFGLYAPGSFGTMRFDEFFCDRFVALYLSHNFSGMLWKTSSRWFKPELTIATNLGLGDMKRAESHPDKNFQTMEKGYFESGFVIKGLLSTPYAQIGAGLFYRYGPYSLPSVWENFAWKWSATFSF
ncbi:MAG: carboxypeptidase-like regulatory domain-containing protein [Bacteroidales bacterium]|nr:carboxypeptidase-like regulatory domain-containing protein [Bacteroidales bacterium]